MIGSLFKAAVGVVTLPVSVAADVVDTVTLGALNDKSETFTTRNTKQVLKNLEKSIK